MPFVKEAGGKMLVIAVMACNQWQEYSEGLLSENCSDATLSSELIIMDVNDLTEADIQATLLKMAHGKAAGPGEVMMKMIKALREVGGCWLRQIRYEVWKEEKSPQNGESPYWFQ